MARTPQTIVCHKCLSILTLTFSQCSMYIYLKLMTVWSPKFLFFYFEKLKWEEQQRKKWIILWAHAASGKFTWRNHVKKLMFSFLKKIFPKVKFLCHKFYKHEIGENIETNGNHLLAADPVKCLRSKQNY